MVFPVEIVPHGGNHAVINTSALGDTTLVSGIPGKRIMVVAYTFTAAGAVNVKFKSGAATDISGPLNMAAAGDGGSPPYNPDGHFITSAGEDLVVNLSAAVQVGGHLTWKAVS